MVDTNKSYNALILAIDYSKGTFDPIPDATLAAYCRHADLWDGIAAIQVPVREHVLDGALTLSIDGLASVVAAAGLATIPRGARHADVNHGSVPVHAMFWALPSRKLPALRCAYNAEFADVELAKP